ARQALGDRRAVGCVFSDPPRDRRGHAASDPRVEVKPQRDTESRSLSRCNRDHGLTAERAESAETRVRPAAGGAGLPETTNAAQTQTKELTRLCLHLVCRFAAPLRGPVARSVCSALCLCVS